MNYWRFVFIPVLFWGLMGGATSLAVIFSRTILVIFSHSMWGTVISLHSIPGCSIRTQPGGPPPPRRVARDAGTGAYGHAGMCGCGHGCAGACASGHGRMGAGVGTRAHATRVHIVRTCAGGLLCLASCPVFAFRRATLVHSHTLYLMPLPSPITCTLCVP